MDRKGENNDEVDDPVDADERIVDVVPETTVSDGRNDPFGRGFSSNGGDLDGRISTDGMGCCLLYTSPSPRDQRGSRMPSSA